MNIKDEQNTEAYTQLAKEIILMAASDYKLALSQIKDNPKDGEAIHEALMIERFFRSDWYIALSSIDGEYMIRRLRKEVEDNE